tara:strand:- start:1615 stop:1881 length:267 start_codon:yes stop_codon:yes gene_type:complete
VTDIIDVLEREVGDPYWSPRRHIVDRVVLFFAAALEPHRAEKLIGHTAFWSEIKSDGMLDWISNEMMSQMIMRRIIYSLCHLTKEVTP